VPRHVLLPHGTGQASSWPGACRGRGPGWRPPWLTPHPPVRLPPVLGAASGALLRVRPWPGLPARLPRAFSRALAHDAGRLSGVAAPLRRRRWRCRGACGASRPRATMGWRRVRARQQQPPRAARASATPQQRRGRSAVLALLPRARWRCRRPSAGRGVPVRLDPRPSGGAGGRSKGGALWMLPVPQCVPPVASAGLQSPSAAQPCSRGACGPAAIWRGSTHFTGDRGAEARRIAREGQPSCCLCIPGSLACHPSGQGGWGGAAHVRQGRPGPKQCRAFNVHPRAQACRSRRPCTEPSRSGPLASGPAEVGQCPTGAQTA